MSALNLCFILAQFVDIARCKSRLIDTLFVPLAALNLATTIMRLAIGSFAIAGFVLEHFGSVQVRLNLQGSGTDLLKL